MIIEEIFKVPIYKVKLDLDIKKLQLFCKEHQLKDTGRTISNVGGYQSNDLSLKDVTLQPLIKEIETHSTKFAKTFINEIYQGVKNVWININSYKDTNKAHMHPNSDISGVYYVKAPSDCGNIVFEHPAYDFLAYYNMIEPKEWNTYNSPNSEKPAIENTLYLFPSWLKHFVGPSQNKTEERISMSFNTGQMIWKDEMNWQLNQVFVPRRID